MPRCPKAGKTEGQLSLISAKSNFNLKCLPPKDFPITQDDVEGEALAISSSVFLKLLNKKNTNQ
jgi:DNA polymerase-3 subunit beta